MLGSTQRECRRTPTTTTAPVNIQMADASLKSSGSTFCLVPTGIVPLFLYSLVAIAAPILFHVHNDEALKVTIGTGSTSIVEGTLIGAMVCYSLVPFFLLVSNNTMRYNLVLAHHCAIEGVMLAIAYTMDSPVYWVVFAVVIVHLLPFFVLSTPRFLTALAFVGVYVNLFFTGLYKSFQVSTTATGSTFEDVVQQIMAGNGGAAYFYTYFPYVAVASAVQFLLSTIWIGTCTCDYFCWLSILRDGMKSMRACIACDQMEV